MMDLSTKRLGYNWDTFEITKKNRFNGIPTGFDRIDRVLLGLPGVVCLMGEPKTGKSTFLMNILMNNAKLGNLVLLIDRENGLYRTRLRMLCNLANLTKGAVESENFYAGEQDRYVSAVEQLKNLPILYYDRIIREELVEAIDFLLANSSKKLVIAVDSINRLIVDYENRRADVDQWMSLFNDLKSRYEGRLTIIFVSEKSQANYGQGGGKAKESGSIEYLAEMVLDMFPSKDKQSVILDCAHNRDGTKGVVSNLFWSNPYTYAFEEADYLED